MREWAKAVLLRNYIGTIVVAMLIVEGVLSIVRAVTFPIPVVAQNWGQSRMSDLDWRQYRFLMSQPVASLISAVLLLSAAYFFARWLYGAPPEPNSDVADSGESEKPQRGDTA